MSTTTEQLPKQELLLKLLKMTTSSNDGEAMTAMRKANELLLSAGWDWDKLIRGKIVVVADPFASVPDPRKPQYSDEYALRRQPFAPSKSTPAAPPPSKPTPRPHTPPPPPPPVGRINSHMPNKFGNSCYCCGVETPPQSGFIFKPRDFGVTQKDGFKVICKSCNNDPNIVLKPYAAPRKVANLADLI